MMKYEKIIKNLSNSRSKMHSEIIPVFDHETDGQAYKLVAHWISGHISCFNIDGSCVNLIENARKQP